ncbi:hypothetical protein [Longispora albida]|uniref:hypothetical protein n=1 Tax=Longispora albida TaxID=203523 RepID=UPI0003764DDA|nr:hypothetical protein [Longispora albida]
MKQRWMPVAAVAGLLFVINAASRLTVKLGEITEISGQDRVAMISFVAVALACAAAGAWWTMRYPMIRLAADLLVAITAGCLLSVFAGPLLTGSQPFSSGLGFLIGQTLQYLAVAGLGTGLGILAVIAFGQDWKAKAWKRHEAEMRDRRTRSKRS